MVGVIHSVDRAIGEPCIQAPLVALEGHQGNREAAKEEFDRYLSTSSSLH